MRVSLKHTALVIPARPETCQHRDYLQLSPWERFCLECQHFYLLCDSCTQEVQQPVYHVERFLGRLS